MLVFSNQSIIDIALLIGYESQQAFTTAFKDMYKKCPNAKFDFVRYGEIQDQDGLSMIEVWILSTKMVLEVKRRL